MAALAAVALLVLLPASDLAIAWVQRVAVKLVPPKRLPRLDFSAGVPETARTMVIVPTMLTTANGVDLLLEHLEVLALGNSDPFIHFAILSDFADTSTSNAPSDDAILARARAGIEALNVKFGEGHADRFFLFHRDRQWNLGERAWIGWERKRGKIEEFNRLLRGASDTSFSTQVGELDVLPTVRYCLTLDSDTRLPRDAAKRLIGIIAHPLNQALVDRRIGQVTAGYGILQPRVSVTMASAAGSLFARTYAGHTGVDPYTSAVSDVYQDLFGEGIFTGKGLYDVDAFTTALDGRVPENALLSHDLFEGLYARTALVTDIEVVDDYPSSVLAHARRQHRWVRGDWQILWWLFPFVPSRAGLARNRLPVIARWKILDNLRRSVLPPATVLLLVLGWTVLPGSPSRGRPSAWRPSCSRPGGHVLPAERPAPPAVVARLRAPGSRRPRNRRGARGAPARLHGQRCVGAAARDRGHPRASRRHATQPAGVGDHGGQHGAGRHGAAARLPLRHEGKSAAGADRLHRRRGAAPVGPARFHADSRPLDRRPVDRICPQPAAAATPRGAVAGGWRLSARGREEDVGVLRGLRRQGGPFPPAGQHPGWREPDRRPSDLADQHRPGPPGDPGRPRSGLHRHARADSQNRSHAHHRRADGTLRRPSPQLVRHADAGPPDAGLRLHGGQRQPGGRAHHAVGRSSRHRTRSLGTRHRALRRDELRISARRQAPAVLDRLPPRRCRWARAARRLVLRPPGVGSASGQLHRHCQRGRAGDALVPPRTVDRDGSRRAAPCSRGAPRCSST